MSGLGYPVAHGHVAQQEHSLPRHEHVLEKYQGVHLLEAGPERVVEVGAFQVEALPAQELQPGRVAGYGEGEGLAPGQARIWRR